MRIGIDTGGTFTDFVLLQREQGLVHKAPSTPGDPLAAILRGLGELCPQGLDGAEVVHGTTVGTNAFLTRSGARVALVTTAGFEDVLFIGRQTRRHLFALEPTRAPELLPRHQVVGVAERVRADGSVLLPLAEDELARVRREVQALQPEAVAVCLLHAYANQAHEQALARILGDLGAPVYLSSRVLPEIREYERTCATVLNAYLAPVLERYLADWSGALPQVPLFIQQSNGGFLPARKAWAWGLATLLSGPAGGVAGAFKVGRDLDSPRLLTLDMGGTSADVALLDGELPFTHEHTLEGYPLGLPVLDIHTVGAGGGSIVWRDRGGALRVGPQSAGADPGPVCYGRGEQLTVTDAQLFLGRLLPQTFLGGRMALDEAATRRAVARLAAHFSATPEELCGAVIRAAKSTMAKALQAVSLERGYDPRDFTLLSFGGAGGLHVCELARELGIRRILVPAQAGVLSALGMARSGLRRDFSRTLLLSGPELTFPRLQQARDSLQREALEELAADGYPREALTAAASLELRYAGQSHTLNVPLTPHFQDDFHRRHRLLYGHDFSDRLLEGVVLRLALQAPPPADSTPTLSPLRGGRAPDLPRRHRVWLPQGWEEAPVLYRPDLEPGFPVQGPALVVEDFATILVSEGFRGAITPQGHLILS
ncbi:MAG: hydantoinase/oxoprolinase family protein [Deltaproteobacteria bacterium]|nr:hydantoinase/oxoprolinase family protein [Deltaproteobacteria bacterium]